MDPIEVLTNEHRMIESVLDSFEAYVDRLARAVSTWKPMCSSSTSLSVCTTRLPGRSPKTNITARNEPDHLGSPYEHESSLLLGTTDVDSVEVGSGRLRFSGIVPSIPGHAV